MDVPFISSGAISRAHYALVHKVETAQSSQLVDQILLAEVHAVRNQLTISTLTTVSRTSLSSRVVLMYRSRRSNAKNA